LGKKPDFGEKNNQVNKKLFHFVTSLFFGRIMSLFFPKQLTVGVLNATLDLAALVLVGVVGFLGSHCLWLSPFMWGVGVGWCGRHLGL